MKKEFSCVSGCGECCGIQPVTKSQLSVIRSALRKKPKREIERMKKQQRDNLMCPLRDLEEGRCFVYGERPVICKMFGYYERLVCPHFPQFATGTMMQGQIRILDETNGEEPIGILGKEFTWKKGLLV